jgi:type III secretion system HrpB4-like protein
MYDSSAPRFADALRAWQNNARGAFAWAHPSWIAHALAIDENDAAKLTGVAPSEAVSLALLDSVSVPTPDLDDITFDALPVDIGLRVLRLRALRFRRSEIRRIVDKRTRTSIMQWAGVPLDRLTHESADERMEAPDIAGLSITPVTMLNATALALEGHALIARDTGCGCALLRLALPRGSPNKRWIDTLPHKVDAQGTRTLVARLPEFLPEWSWLFG